MKRKVILFSALSIFSFGVAHADHYGHSQYGLRYSQPSYGLNCCDSTPSFQQQPMLEYELQRSIQQQERFMREQRNRDLQNMYQSPSYGSGYRRNYR